jgi:sigma-B regulation protein RsbU (phosphoserine phosphatase)
MNQTVKMLVVDDEPDLESLIRQKFRKQIKESEYEFVFAQNGVEALARIGDDPDISVILSDINMPEMDGLTLLQKLDELNNPGIKAVIVSAYGDMENIRTAMNRGAFDFITKPIDFNDLDVTLNKTIRQLGIIREALKEHDQLISVQRDLTIAARIQQSILPRKFPPFPHRKEFDIFASMVPAKFVGGDFYDFFFLDDDRLGFVVGDVSGKGMPAAIFMALSRTLLKAMAMKIPNPGECLYQVNNLLIPESDSAMFVTIFYGVLNTRTGEVEYSSGGHNPPYLVRRDETVSALDNVGGPLVGKFANLKFESQTIRLQTGDTLYMYTDGVTEAMDKDQNLFDDERLISYLKKAASSTPDRMIGDAFVEIKEFVKDAPQSDDITMLSLRYLGSVANA